MKKKYLAPATKQITVKMLNMIALSGGETTQGTVHDPEDEVDAEEALSRRLFEDDWW